jgi:hypothetical protein
MTIQEIEKAISQLPAKDLAELVSWIHEHHHDLWEQQIEQDLESGRLDSLLSEVEREYAAGAAKSL